MVWWTPRESIGLEGDGGISCSRLHEIAWLMSNKPGSSSVSLETPRRLKTYPIGSGEIQRTYPNAVGPHISIILWVRFRIPAGPSIHSEEPYLGTAGAAPFMLVSRKASTLR